MKRFVFIALLLLLILPASVACAANDWIGTGATNLWTDVDNWSEGFAPPDATTHPANGWDDPNGPFYPLTPDPNDDFPRFSNAAHLSVNGTTTLIDDTVTNATAYGLYVGFDGANNLLEMTGGSLTVGEWHLDVGRGFNRHGNPNPHATMIMSGGTIDTALIKVPEQFVDPALAEPYDTAPISGELIMTGGTINARKINVGQFVGDGSATFSGDAVVNLIPNVPGDPNNGGHLEMKQDWFIDGLPVPTVSDAHIDISGNAIINIFGHISSTKSIPDQDEIDRYQDYVDNGWFTAWGGTAEPVITFENNMITITAPPLAAVPGDYNADGTVNAADYAVFRDALGDSIVLPGENSEATTPGLIDQEDYEFWKANFGSMAGPALVNSTTKIPEAGTGALAALCLAMFTTSRGRPQISLRRRVNPL